MTVKRIVLAGAVAIVIVVAALSGPAMAQDSQAKAPGVNPVVATVNGQAIHLSDVEEARALLPSQMQGAPLGAVFPMLIDSLINARLAADKAKASGFDKKPEYKLRMERISDRILERMLLTQHIEKRLTEEVVQARYVKIAERAKDQSEVHARHILVKAEDEAKAIIAKLNSGADFAEMAKAHSTGPTGPTGGDLGWFGPGRMVKPFDAAAQLLAVGTYTKMPVQTQFGWHVISVEERRPVTVPSYDEARSMLVNELSTELGQDLMVELRKDAKFTKTSYEELVKSLQ